MKYVWSAAGIGMIAIPVFFYERKDGREDSISDRTQSYVTSKKLLVTAAEAIERIMLALKDITELT